ncbi:hypothetical protein Rs2_23260 [Raphanus sativus]|uniref:Protein MARD1 n=1 Tax=Raphanus sativus TaxID=3726 RepID=A0A6J0NXY6_RAPSA|nr:protein MARD1 [Raphanus sativus]KAJ4896466.1 hypothetical protein Rs2_23260 [Raphanus sativus]
MADQLPSPTPNTYYPSVFFSSPKFRFFSPKITHVDSIISPTSTLEANHPFLFFSSSKIPKPQRFLHPPEAFGLADLVKNRDRSNKPVNMMVLFGSKLRVQIPSPDFGTKSAAACTSQLSPCLKTKVLTVSEVDQTTEDYTRVISHGPNPTITHIFDNSVFVEATPPSSVSLPQVPTETKNNFFSYCYTCNKNLDQKHDIYIYRGEKGFCSSECRYQEMLLDQIDG